MKPLAVLAIDQGTTGSRAILYDGRANKIASSYTEFRQYYPHPGWVEHNAAEIWNTVRDVSAKALKQAGLKSSRLAGIGITNQRETTVLWDKKTGKPVHHAIVWQDRRTAPYTQKLKRRGVEKTIRHKTGLVLDPYFSGTKIQWLLEHVPGLMKRAKAGRILFGTMDTWLLWKLTGGKAHATDLTNASRTLLLNIRTRRWDPQLLRIFRIPSGILPEVKESGALFGKTESRAPFTRGIPIAAIMGDQQAALYGQGCYRPGQLKNTYGTGSFVVINMGKRYRKPPFGLLSTLACDQNGNSVYALEGSIFISGAAIQWLRDGLHFFKHAKESEQLARRVKDTGGVVLIPALTGLGAPYWDPRARGMISGLTRGTTREHIIRAALEGIAHQSADVVDWMKKNSPYPIRQLKVDGGATANRFLMQFQADILGLPVMVSDLAESTAWGVAKLAAHRTGFWRSLSRMDRRRRYRRFAPRMKAGDRAAQRDLWRQAMQRLTDS